MKTNRKCTLFILIVISHFVFCTNTISKDENDSINYADKEKKEAMLSLYNEYKEKNFSEINDMYASELLKLKDNQYILVDVREKYERSISTIPGAITKNEFEKNKESFKEKIIISYCTIGYRSGTYTKDLLKKGFNAYNLIGSVLGWAHEGQYFLKDDKKTYEVHVYGETWDLLPEGYTGIY